MAVSLSDLVKKFFGTSAQVLYTGQSLFGPVRVTRAGDRTDLYTGARHLQSSYYPSGKLTGSVWDYYLIAPLFLSKDKKPETLCLLGLGAGVTANLFRRYYPAIKITGVEVDPLIVELGKKYFSLRERDLEIIVADAAVYIRETEAKFDLIIVDTFQQDCFTAGCETAVFYENVRQRLNPGGVVLVNRALTEKQDRANEQFQALFLAKFLQVYAVPVHHNLFYLGLTTPLPRATILDNIQTASRGPLAFLKKFNRISLRLLK